MHCLCWTWQMTETIKRLKSENIRFDKWFWCYYRSRNIWVVFTLSICTLASLTRHIISPEGETFWLPCAILSVRTTEVEKLAPGRNRPAKKQKRKAVPRSDEQRQRNTAGLRVNFNALALFSDQNVHVFSLSRGFSKPKRIFAGFIEYSPESVYTKSKENDSHSSWKHRIFVLLAE